VEVSSSFETLAFCYRKARCHVSEDRSLILVIRLQNNIFCLLKSLRMRNCGALPTRLWTPWWCSAYTQDLLCFCESGAVTALPERLINVFLSFLIAVFCIQIACRSGRRKYMFLFLFRASFWHFVCEHILRLWVSFVFPTAIISLSLHDQTTCWHRAIQNIVHDQTKCWHRALQNIVRDQLLRDVLYYSSPCFDINFYY
jgi:hypothetical protein